MKRALAWLWRGWKRLAHVLGVVNTRVLLTLTWGLVLGAASIVARLVRADLLETRRPLERMWHPRTTGDVSRDACRRPF